MTKAGQKLRLTDEGKHILDSILAYENPMVVQRFSTDKNVSTEYANRVFLAFKQFMAVSAFKGGRLTASLAIDEMWHTFVLHTRQYAEFCEKYMNEFVHHEPMADDSSPNFYLLTRMFAENMFGTLDEELWPLQPQLGSRCISGCDRGAPPFAHHIVGS